MSAITRRRSRWSSPRCAISPRGCARRAGRSITSRSTIPPTRTASPARSAARSNATRPPRSASSKAPNIASAGCRTNGPTAPAFRSTILPDDRFLCSLPDFYTWAQGRREHRMEYFYRDMRRRTGLLMTADGKPEGGEWNYDKDNRDTPAARAQLSRPAPLRRPMRSPPRCSRWSHPNSATISAISSRSACPSPANRRSRRWRISSTPRCPISGGYQDAMVAGQDYLYHSALSSSLNLGLLTPAAKSATPRQDAYRRGAAPLNSVEGFIRQIIGWREYIRGMYWWDMPEFADAQRAGRDPAAARFLLDGRNRHALPARKRRPDEARSLCASYPAADGARQFRADRGDRARRRFPTGSWSSISTPMNGSNCPTSSA